MREVSEHKSFAHNADDILAEVQRNGFEHAQESRIRSGTFTAGFLQALGDCPVEVSLRDKGADTLLAAGSSDSIVHPLLNPLSMEEMPSHDRHLRFEAWKQFLSEYAASKIPVHTHPGGAAYHCPSLADVRISPSRQYEYNAAFELVVTQLGIIVYQRLSKGLYEQLFAAAELLESQHYDLTRAAHEAHKQKNDVHPALVELAQKELLLFKRAGAVIADILWTDPKIHIIVDTLNRKKTPDEAIDLLKQ